jgi:hypothetical protein
MSVSCVLFSSDRGGSALVVLAPEREEMGQSGEEKGAEGKRNTLLVDVSGSG